ncbi:MAG: tRNA (guanosine(37)-N1)-methyltransferase TrmD [Clostridia bacterium]|nr:tRNA (guanosine(37)-N1)-methyltransferase TrmD [Clostridia bacterium]
MRFDVLTLFPDMLEAVLGNSIIGRARDAGLVELNFTDIRDFTKNKHRKVDDTPYSGGGGMLMSAEPVYEAYMSIAGGLDYKPYTVYMSPQGRVFDQNEAIRLSKYGHIILLCGHYEGIDQRVLDEIVDAEISIGDFVLTGGEIPAMVVIDTVARLIPGVLANDGSFQNESHFQGLLEHPQYTKPRVWHGVEVPEVLLSGNHKEIDRWKHEQSLLATMKKRPDMLREAWITEEDAAFVEKHREDS